MNFIGHILLIAVAVCVISAVPHDYVQNVPSNNPAIQILLAETRAATLISTRDMSPEEVDCANDYLNATKELFNDLTNKTNDCFNNANKTMENNDANANATVDEIRDDAILLQNNLSNCTNSTGTEFFINCITQSTDKNLAIMDRMTSNAYMIQGQMATNDTLVKYERDACINSVAVSCNIAMTKATNEYKQCLLKVESGSGNGTLLN